MELTIVEIMTKFAGALVPETLQGINAVMQLRLTGSEKSDWIIELENGDVLVKQGLTPSPQVTFTVDSIDFVRLINSELDPMQAFVQGKLKLEGDFGLAMKLTKLFNK